MRLIDQKKQVKLGLNIAYYRRLKGYSQEELGEIVDVSRNQIGRIENAESAPSLGLIFDICDALEITEKQLFDFKE